MSRPDRSTRGEEGATLILALVFVLLMSGIMLAILTLSGTNILDSTTLQNERTLEYSAEGGAQIALQAVRYLTPSQTTAYCPNGRPASSPPAPINGTSVYCQVGTLLYSRVVTFEVCPSTATASNCSGNVGDVDVIRASVQFSDVAAGCSGPLGSGCYNPVGAATGSTSGTSVTIESWIEARANG